MIAALKAGSFGGGIRLRVPVTAGAAVVGELVRRPRTGWHAGPGNAYRFSPNDEGLRMGLRHVTESPSIRDAIAKAAAPLHSRDDQTHE